MRKIRGLLATVVAVTAVAACANTWRGVKEDTRENTQAVGQGVQQVGKKIEKQAQ